MGTMTNTQEIQKSCRHIHLGPCPVHECPTCHGRFTHYAFNGAVCWCCRDCGGAGTYVGDLSRDGEFIKEAEAFCKAQS